MPKWYTMSPNGIYYNYVTRTTLNPRRLNLPPELLAQLHQTFSEEIHPPPIALVSGAVGHEADAQDAVERVRVDELPGSRSRKGREA
ncbi:hypothetical protein CHU98_g2398 [Xylaria longipes]|nr:hypothetical protein CHU98_g2398 [Xylaria longipes]